MPDIMSPQKRSQLMSRIRGKDTVPEQYVVALLRTAGFRFTQNDKTLPGRPDVSFPSRRVAVFVHGDFWHGWRLPAWKSKLSLFWRTKISMNRARDRRNARRLTKLGWRVVRLWEHQVEEDVVACVRRVADVLGKRNVDWKVVGERYQEMKPLRRRNRLPRVRVRSRRTVRTAQRG